MKRIRWLSAYSIVLLCIFSSVDAQGQVYCDPDRIDGSIACGDIIKFRSSVSGHYNFAFTFDAVEGEVCAFRGDAPLYPEASIKIWIATGDCTFKFVEDPPDPGPSAVICPFFVPKSGTYVLGIRVYGRRGPLYMVRRVCLDPANVDCGSVPVEQRNWGQVKALYD